MDIKNCVQPYKDIQFEELKEQENKKRGYQNKQNNKRGKPDEDDSNMHYNDDKLHNPKQNL